ILLVVLYKSKLQYIKHIFFIILSVLSILVLSLITGNFELNYSFDYGFLRGIAGFFTGSFCYYIFSIIYTDTIKLKKVYFSVLEITTLLILTTMIYYGSVFKEIGFIYEFIF